MPFNFKLPQWNKSEPDPPQSKLDAGFGPGEKPSASLFNWFFNLVSAALSEIKNNGETTTGAQAKVDAHANNTSIHVTPADKTRWDAAANANPSMFASVSVKTSTGAQKGNNLAADQSADTLNIQEGSAIIITPNDATDTMTIAVDTTQFAPAAHVGAGGAAHAVATQSAAGFMAAADKTKLDGIATGAEVNQNTFATIAVKNNAGTSKGSVAADSKQDTATFREGTAILMTADSATDEITISVDSAQFAPAAHVGAGGAAHAVATQSAAGFMSAADYTKLQGIQAGATVNKIAVGTYTGVHVGGSGVYNEQTITVGFTPIFVMVHRQGSYRWDGDGINGDQEAAYCITGERTTNSDTFLEITTNGFRIGGNYSSDWKKNNVVYSYIAIG